MKYTFKQIVLLTLMLGAACGCMVVQSSKNQNPDFEIIKAEYEPWVAGIYKGGSGIDYRIQLLVQKKGTYQFDSLWTNNTRLKANISIHNENIENLVELNTTDTLLVRAFFTKHPAKEFSKITPPKNIEKNQALIRYYSNNKAYFINVDTLKLVKGIPRP